VSNQVTTGLHRAVNEQHDRIATICNDRVLTFIELADRVARLASGFNSLGLSKKTPIAMLAFNSDYYLQYYLACGWGDYWANPVNFRWNIDEIVYSLNDSRSQAIIVDEHFVSSVAEIVAKCDRLRCCIHVGRAIPKIDTALPFFSAIIAGQAPVIAQPIAGQTTTGTVSLGITPGLPNTV